MNEKIRECLNTIADRGTQIEAIKLYDNMSIKMSELMDNYYLSGRLNESELAKNLSDYFREIRDDLAKKYNVYYDGLDSKQIS